MKPDVMRSHSVTVKMTPRQAVAAARALEPAGSNESWSAYRRVIVAMHDAGWRYDERGDGYWHLDAHRIVDRAPE